MKFNFLSNIEKFVSDTVEKPFATKGKFELFELDRIVKKALNNRKKHLLNHTVLPNHINIYMNEIDYDDNKLTIPEVIKQLKLSLYQFSDERGYDIHNNNFELSIISSDSIPQGEVRIKTEFIGIDSIKGSPTRISTNIEPHPLDNKTAAAKPPYRTLFLKVILLLLIMYGTLHVVGFIASQGNLLSPLNKFFSTLLGMYAFLTFFFLITPEYFNKKYEDRLLYFTLCLIFTGNLLVFVSFLTRPVPWQITIGILHYNLSGFLPDLIYTILYSIVILSIFLVLYKFLKNRFPQLDSLFLINIFFLSGVGLTLLFSVAPGIALHQNNPALALLPMKQFLWTLVGITVFIFAVVFIKNKHYTVLRRKKYIYLFLSVVLIGLTGIFGHEIHGKRLWLILGPFSFQTIEAVKLLLLLFIAGYLNDEGAYLQKAGSGYGFDKPVWRYLGPFLLSWAIALLPIILQKDIGPTFILFSIFVFMFYVGTGNVSLPLSAFFLTVLLGVFCYYAGYPSIVHTRIDMWLHPFGVSETVASSLWSVAGGGLFGQGIGEGIAYKIPMVQSDYNFAALCEKLGFIGSAAVLLSYTIITYKGMKIALETDDTYKKLMAAGITILFALQVVVIIAGNLNIIPLTGITLPLISYGGSSMVVSFLMLGILLNISLSEGKSTAHEEH